MLYRGNDGPRDKLSLKKSHERNFFLHPKRKELADY